MCTGLYKIDIFEIDNDVHLGTMSIRNVWSIIRNHFIQEITPLGTLYPDETKIESWVIISTEEIKVFV